MQIKETLSKIGSTISYGFHATIEGIRYVLSGVCKKVKAIAARIFGNASAQPTSTDPTKPIQASPLESSPDSQLKTLGQRVTDASSTTLGGATTQESKQNGTLETQPATTQLKAEETSPSVQEKKPSSQAQQRPAYPHAQALHQLNQPCIQEIVDPIRDARLGLLSQLLRGEPIRLRVSAASVKGGDGNYASPLSNKPISSYEAFREGIRKMPPLLMPPPPVASVDEDNDVKMKDDDSKLPTQAPVEKKRSERLSPEMAGRIVALYYNEAHKNLTTALRKAGIEDPEQQRAARATLKKLNLI